MLKAEELDLKEGKRANHGALDLNQEEFLQGWTKNWGKSRKSVLVA